MIAYYLSETNFLQFGNQLKKIRVGCVPFGKSKNGFLILVLPDFVVEWNDDGLLINGVFSTV